MQPSPPPAPEGHGLGRVAEHDRDQAAPGVLEGRAVGEVVGLRDRLVGARGSDRFDPLLDDAALGIALIYVPAPVLMPYTGEPGLERGDPDKPRSGYASRFSHKDERAEPGYYAVTLDDHRVRAELTASERVGVHRYRFPAGEQAKVLLDLRTSLYDYPGKILWSRLRAREDGTITGFRETRGWAPGRQLYFAMPAKDIRLAEESRLLKLSSRQFEEP